MRLPRLRKLWVIEILEGARFEYAPEGRKSVPKAVIGKLAMLDVATPKRVQFIIDRCQDQQEKDPIDLLFVGLGAREHKRGKPWEVPMVFSIKFDAIREQRERMWWQQARLDVMRTMPPEHGGEVAKSR